MDQVRAKFHCESIVNGEYSNTVNMRAVIGTEGENKDFNDATPTGTFSMEVNGKVPAATFFEVGEDYYLDITKAE